MKTRLNAFVKKLVCRLVDTEEVHDALAPLLDRSAVVAPAEMQDLVNIANPYSEKTCAPLAPLEYAPVFVTSRFRSGSTALWNAFRQMDNATAYYEPFNERQFFNPKIRGNSVDRTHIGVDDYAAEYDNTPGLSELANLYHVDWIRRELYMSSSACNPRMKRFIDILIDKTPNRAILQFNRVDFRLPWLAHQFPNASIVHLYRNPREQWCSFLININEFPREISPTNFNYRFYLDRWARDLAHVIPILRTEHITHPYQMFYLVWKLSYIFGRRYATTSLSYEELARSPELELQKLLTSLQIDDADIDKMSSVISPPHSDRAPEYAEPSWYESHETYCESLINEYFKKSTSDIRGVQQP